MEEIENHFFIYKKVYAQKGKYLFFVQGFDVLFEKIKYYNGHWNE